MPQDDAEGFLHSDYSQRADEWINNLKAHSEEGHVALNGSEIADLVEVFGRAVAVCKAATGCAASIEYLNFAKGSGLELGMNHWGAQLIAESLHESLKSAGAENYLELQFNGHPKGPLMVRMYFRGDEIKTPAQVACERKEWIDDLEIILQDKNKEIEELKDEIQGLEQCVRE